MGIIGHWISPEFEKREGLLEFSDIFGLHSRKNLAQMPIDYGKSLGNLYREMRVDVISEV